MTCHGLSGFRQDKEQIWATGQPFWSAIGCFFCPSQPPHRQRPYGSEGEDGFTISHWKFSPEFPVMDGSARMLSTHTTQGEEEQGPDNRAPHALHLSV